MKYIVWFNDKSIGFGCCVHLIGIFDTKELAEEAIENVKTKIKPYIQTEANASRFEINLVGVNVNEINYPKYDWWGYYSKYILGGYAE